MNGNILTNAIRAIDITGNIALMATAVLQSTMDPKKNSTNNPTLTFMFAKEVISPRILGSVISPIYANPGASMNPALTPIIITDKYNISVDVAVYNRIHDINSGMFISIIPDFRPM